MQFLPSQDEINVSVRWSTRAFLFEWTAFYYISHKAIRVVHRIQEVCSCQANIVVKVRRVFSLQNVSN